MSPSEIFGLAGTLSAVIAAAAVLFASLKTNTAKVWREEAEAQKSRADRLEASLKEINTRLSRIEQENERLVQLLTSLDPSRLAVVRLTNTSTED
ncbi:hypothetical protein [Streptomyces sp. NBC_01751]|uniref:hypothetical protein n=1 Tax=Streptomyces sp. NBC_01751 TaxID=2975929 RepID=UPI002DDA989F|nr:hypothetical protein [Streptomyces sp. NBC_01751]WSD24556.1 hypothetical protein OHA26_14270 [Streptomyces sp. NBC_01751]